MSFWSSKKIKAARKTHKCAYCGKRIKIGESYSRETGINEGSFDDYCLCNRCRWFIDRLQKENELLGEFLEDLTEYELITCPACDRPLRVTQCRDTDMMVIDCKCPECGEEWTADLSVEGLREVMWRRE